MVKVIYTIRDLHHQNDVGIERLELSIINHLISFNVLASVRCKHISTTRILVISWNNTFSQFSTLISIYCTFSTLASQVYLIFN